MDFRIRQLQCFLTLSELLNYNQTARSLYMTQPAITFQIRSLEDSFGVKLFERDRQGVRLTEAGAAFRGYARTILDTVRAAQDRFSELHKGLRLRTSCGPVGQFILLPAVLRALNERYPGFELEVVELTTEQMMTALPEGKVDALLMVGRLPIGELCFDAICEEPLAAFVSKASPLARQRSLSVEKLRHTPLIATRREECRFHEPFLHDLLKPFGIVPQIVASAQSCSMQFAYAAAGRGLVIAPQVMSGGYFPDVVGLTFREDLPAVELGLATMRGNASAALSLFRQVVMECAATMLLQTQGKGPQWVRPERAPLGSAPLAARAV